MKNYSSSFGKTAAVALALVWLACVPVWAQSAAKSTETGKATKTFTGEIWDSVNAQRGSREQMMKENGLTTPLQTTLFAVHYMNPPAKYVLYDPGTKKIYQLDDQDRVQPYAAEKVKVTGSYDEATLTIHVTDIQSDSQSSSKGSKE